LDAKHEQELKDFKAQQNDTPDNVAERVSTISLDNTNDATSNETKAKKPSKAQKRREKKEAENKAREANIAEQEVANLSGARHIEAQKIKEILGRRGLTVFSVPSDGNCLYTALVDQLSRQGIEADMSDMRKKTAAYIRANKDDIMPFLCDHNTGEPYDDEAFEKYCSDTENTPAWGGQLEIKALSNVLDHPIEIVQADSPPLVIGEDTKNTPLILSYHRHIYSLGEHYNSVIEKPEEDEEDT
ncbi:unnamed protein product, partial [Owenia fusiformis]